jgi:methylated-DNA-protein-cysteine methyltransferase-like protein
MPSLEIETAIVAFIRKIPYGRVSSYGAVARAAGFPQHARRVAWTLRRGPDLPWHRVLGAGGEIKLRGDSAMEQRLRLEAEGVSFRGRTVDMSRCEFKFPPARQKAGRSRSPGRKPAALKLRSV